MSPLFRRMAEHPRLELTVAYCTLRGAEEMHDPEFNVTVKWDVPLLEGYSWQEVANLGSGDQSFFGLCNPGLWKMIRDGGFDAVVSYVGYVCATFWIAWLAARLSGSAFLFGTDASSLAPRDASTWKVQLKKKCWPHLFRLANQVFVPSTPTFELMQGLGIDKDRITLTPFVVDNDWWTARAKEVEREKIRDSWSVASDEVVILFCAKLQPWKRPGDLLRAFARMKPTERAAAILVYAGDGNLRAELENEATMLGIRERVRFLGFVNQTQLPGVYTAADLMVLPSEYEPFAVVVNEASCCGCPVVVSDRVGAARDLVAPVNPELIYSCGDVESLQRILSKCILEKGNLSALGQRALERMETWSPKENVAGIVEGIERAVERRLGILRGPNSTHR
jgi:glycosyltransferase involved in cell wall biosynthesis